MAISLFLEKRKEMRGFFKAFFASFLALVIFSLLVLVSALWFFSALLSKEKPVIDSNAVLYLDLSTHFREAREEDPFAELAGEEPITPGLYDLIRMIRAAKKDNKVSGIYISCNSNHNGFASSEEIRQALKDFKKSGKFIYAYGDMIDQKAYYVGNVADRIYCNPRGGMEWVGLSAKIVFLKKALEKLEIEPQIFYDGKFKSATEPFREEKMTEANRIQTHEWLGDLYRDLVLHTSESRNIDTAQLYAYANEGIIQTTEDAVHYKLIDGALYDDQVKDELKNKLKLADDDKINFVPVSEYYEAHPGSAGTSSNRIAVIYAEGDIVYGKGDEHVIGSNDYQKIIRRIRYDEKIKAVVLRVNSPGGSAIASEVLWRELSLLKKAGKPLVVSMGDYAASGGYYISVAADSIFAQLNTLTGSIGVFGILPNMENFFKNKLGITFDGVKTAPYADRMTITRPLTETEKQFFQNSIDTIYADFKARVAKGRKKDIAYIDSVAQGRVWSGEDAVALGLADKTGGLDDAIASAASMAGIKDYRLNEYPEPKTKLEKIFGKASNPFSKSNHLKEEMGEQAYQVYLQYLSVKRQLGTAQSRLPYEVIIQ